MKSPCRVVIDTNLVLSALIFRNGRLVTLRLTWQNPRVRPLISQVTATELIRALAYPKFRLAATEREELLADYLPYCESVKIPNPPPVTPPCRDVFDVPFLHLAVAGKADALVTGDKDLLVLAGDLSCPVLSAEQFLQTVSKDMGTDRG